MHHLTGNHADFDDSDDFDHSFSPEDEAYTEYEHCTGDDSRRGNLSRLAGAAGKARPQKDRHGRLVSPKRTPAQTLEPGVSSQPRTSLDVAPAHDRLPATTGMVCSRSLGRYGGGDRSRHERALQESHGNEFGGDLGSTRDNRQR